MNEAVKKNGVSVTTLVRSAWNSMALRAAAALGLGGVALATTNLIFARVMPAGEFAQFALLYSIVHIGINAGPIGADVALQRRLILPNARLMWQSLLTSAVVAALLVVGSAVLYPLDRVLLAAIFICVTTGGLEIASLAYYRSRDRIGFSLIMSSCCNAAIFTVALIALAVPISGAIWPAAAMCVAFLFTAVYTWQGIRTERSDWSGPGTPYPWKVGWAATSFIAAGIVLNALDRLAIPRLLGMEELATFTVLATIAGSPFTMLYQAVSYTLVSRLRNAASREQRLRVLGREATVVAITCTGAAIGILWLMPYMLKWVLAGRYAIGFSLIIAVIIVGCLKVLSSLLAAAVNALGSPRELMWMSYIGWSAIIVGLAGAAVGAHFGGLLGLIYGVGVGWLLRAMAVGSIAIPKLYGEKSDSHEP
jgi:O-antigen/teichoic acid export membrane protein